MRLHFFHVLAATTALLCTAIATAADITGAGATFPYPIYAKWADKYHKETGIRLNYQSIGSGGGIKQIKARTVDFGASDKPLTREELEKDGLTQFPTVLGGVVPITNLEGIEEGQVKLTGKVLADIFLGKIKRWNDASIAALNEGIVLPASNIAIVHRADGSGTTFLFTDYLSKVSPEWKTKVGAATSVAWPTGTGGKGNEGVANFVKRIKNSIGYVEAAYVKQNKLHYVQLQNLAGHYVLPTEESFRASAANAEWDKDSGFYEILTDKPGSGSWPITGATFILMHKSQSKPAQAMQVLKFFEWAYAHGNLTALELDYIPLPDNLVALIKTSWEANIKGKDGRAIYTVSE
ncbi:phosphate ABC transporter substrate-binding protein PstS [Nitrosomonas ureae]|uniref:Phosphate-binding protein PstS n=1 Tax=Nitrosomonas ureae TaxID=44577 RepID=A0A1H2ET54_9PROT|nr:phosphate ABC transporter substrate-binding protein PstS [Nitrosomonas ureae]ALQ51474.1 phosphate ABC transporter substrate-binding protein [Nitrosomonas ureae]SDT98254.1 phosphate ABC transporter substrate-binding protein, PhoT family [Nitrosomonas ureae]